MRPQKRQILGIISLFKALTIGRWFYFEPMIDTVVSAIHFQNIKRMKTILLLTSLIFASIPTKEKEKIEIASQKTVELSYKEYADYDVNLSSTSNSPIEVAVIDPVSRKQVQGFGLGAYGNATLSIQPNHVLQLKNNSTKSMNMVLEFVERKSTVSKDETVPGVNFTLHNSSLKSIPLVIPGVMNPNLSPMSDSGVYLKIGQKIYFKEGSERRLLLKVDETIKQGDKVDVAALIKKLNKD